MKNVNEQLGTMPIPKLLLKFSLPAIAGMMVNSLYNLVDRIYVGRIGAMAMTGIGLVFPFMALITAVSSLIGIGSAAIISMRLGQDRKKDAEVVVGNAFTLLTILMIIVTSIALIFKTPILNLFGASEVTIGYASDYITIILYGTIFQGIGLGLNNLIRAEGSPTKAMITILLGAIINIILDPIFIFTLDMGIAGAAWATIISQFISAIWVFSHFIGKKGNLKLRKKYLKPRLTAIKDILSVGLAPFSMQMASVFVNVILNKSLTRYGGDIAIGAMTIVNSTTILFLLPILGITQGAQPIIGFNYGAKQYDRVTKTLKIELIAATALCVFTFIMTQLFPEALVKIYNSEPELVEVASRGMKICFMLIPVVGTQIVSSNFFQAIGKAATATILSLLRQVVVLIPMLLLLPRFYQLTGVWAALPVSDLIASIITVCFLLREINKLGKLKMQQIEAS